MLIDHDFYFLQKQDYKYCTGALFVGINFLNVKNFDIMSTLSSIYVGAGLMGSLLLNKLSSTTTWKNLKDIHVRFLMQKINRPGMFVGLFYICVSVLSFHNSQENLY